MIQVYYNCASGFGSGFSSGSQRFANENDFVCWMRKVIEETGKPILITAIEIRA